MWAHSPPNISRSVSYRLTTAGNNRLVMFNAPINRFQHDDTGIINNASYDGHYCWHHQRQYPVVSVRTRVMTPWRRVHYLAGSSTARMWMLSILYCQCNRNAISVVHCSTKTLRMQYQSECSSRRSTWESQPPTVLVLIDPPTKHNTDSCRQNWESVGNMSSLGQECSSPIITKRAVEFRFGLHRKHSPHLSIFH